jgi:peptidoglycan/LPS O-acetylase OafA/YrhL
MPDLTKELKAVSVLEGQSPVRRTDGTMLPALTSLRFFAALSIVVHHVKGLFLPADFFPAISFGRAVSFFFVLSGFILVHVYPSLPTGRDVARFLVSRAARLWPAHLFGLLLVLVFLHHDAPLNTPGPLLANIFLIHAWIPITEYFFGYNGPSWTISTELGFYLLFPLLIYRFDTTWWWKLMLSAASLVALVALATYWDMPTFPPPPGEPTRLAFIYMSPLGRLFEFVLGMTAALFWRRAPRVNWLGTAGWTVIEIAAFAVLAAQLWYVPWMYMQFYFSPLTLMREWPDHAGGCFSFVVVVFVMASSRGLIARMLSFPVFVLLGEASYAVYILHQVLSRIYAQYFHAALQLPYWAGLPLYLAALIGLSIATFYWIENPIRRWAKGLVSARQRAPINACDARGDAVVTP